MYLHTTSKNTQSDFASQDGLPDSGCVPMQVPAAPPHKGTSRVNWWAYQPKVVLPGGEVMPQAGLHGGRVHRQVHRQQGVGSDQRQLPRKPSGLWASSACRRVAAMARSWATLGPHPSDASVNFKEENIVVGITSLSLICDPFH